MLATLNLSDVKFIDEQDEDDDYEAEMDDAKAATDAAAAAAGIRGLQQQWQRHLSRDSWYAPAYSTAGARSDAAWLLSPCIVDRSEMASASPGYSSLSRSSSMSSSITAAAFDKPKQLIRTASVQQLKTSSPSSSAVFRQGTRSTPPKTLQIQPCVDRSLEWKQAASVGCGTASLVANQPRTVSTFSTATGTVSSESTRSTENVFTGLKKEDTLSDKDQGDGCVAWRKFVPRHDDEVFLETGDPVEMEEEFDDLWCKGLNIRTGKKGVFPSVCLTDAACSTLERPAAADVPISALPTEKASGTQTFVVRFLGSVEAKRSSGVEVLVEAIRKVTCHLVQALLNQTQDGCCSGPAPMCRLTVSPLGVHLNGNPCKSSSSTPSLNDQSFEDDRIAETKKKRSVSVKPCHEGAITSHFFPFKNITYSGRHPENSRYLAFITKHPTDQRYACHCLAIQESDSNAALVIREILMQRLSGPTVARTCTLTGLLRSDITNIS